MSLKNILNRVTQAEMQSGRPVGTTTLIAVSKIQPNEKIRQVLSQGHRVFGENRIQEAKSKWPDFHQDFADIELHIIGPLQTNKARVAFDLAQVIHSLDRSSLATTLARLAQDSGRCPDLFVQVNTGEEPQKAGVLPHELDVFIAQAQQLDLPVIGLMCIPPVDQDPAPHFRMLAGMAHENGLPNLSMGMSNDFEIAIALGATHIRVGSALFGAREYEI